jgi:8-oxo-dGTP pyrophosphatase MutT (NUDIX family)
MALLFRRGSEWRLPLIVRPPDSLHHAGQVSLPGGAIESGEEAPDAALREVEEELGIPRDKIRILGPLSPLYVFTSNHYVQPFVGSLCEDPTFELNSLEVARLLEMPVEFLVQPASLGHIERNERGVCANAPAYHWDGEPIWGATCMILAELAAVLREAD